MVTRRRSHTICVGHIFPKQMNVYGDMGNVLTLEYRLKQRGFRFKYLPIDSIGDLLGADVDILVGGGGQDKNQESVQQDVVKYAPELQSRSEAGLVMLMVCGMYQLFGHYFSTSSGEIIKGASVLDLETRANDSRLIGNIVTMGEFGRLVGFENHSGRTFLGSEVQPLGVVVKGAGNNGESGEEGAVLGNTFGTYLHGPVLAKAPHFSDMLISRALQQRGLNTELDPIDDTLSLRAAEIAAERPR